MGTLCSLPRAQNWQQAQQITRFPLQMANLSGLGLSEPWLLRMAGDRHWQLIAQTAGQTGVALHDADGHSIYAAFCSTALRIAPRARGLMDAQVTLESTLYQVSSARLGSVHVLSHPEMGILACLRMISCFLCHDETGSNRRLMRKSLPGLSPLPLAPTEVMALERSARDAARLARSVGPETPILCYTPLPALDFNAVGLLYFPTFSKIAEMARPHWNAGITRNVTYLSNLDAGEDILVETMDAGLLLRAQDGRALAVID
ncbi:hypothetical protein BFP70_09915 [Thioclava sp. SK-1]|uniref:Pnap_2097 family protein n=1 Tax=Thioclava sp. SK-1 TaxID=1889770 RepID=UPI000825673C|nr:Pnap_2097 family protein [Thioclava sp. SK-1]OCX65369.1 hypothetical protein BFP70_09915 [Thioclava sp. SK-1]